jgi:hypothetical protein
MDVYGNPVLYECKKNGSPKLAIFLSKWVCSPCSDRLFEELFVNNINYLKDGLVIVTENWNIRKIIQLSNTYKLDSEIIFMEGKLTDEKIILDKPAIFLLNGDRVEKPLIYDDALKLILPQYLDRLHNK